jgi:CRISPR-associated exonuclease Cas4
VFSEDELLPLSALQHLIFCERQCALIHVEKVWVDNVLTVEGTALHQRVDEEPGETRGTLRVARGLALRRLRLGLSGRADAVEFRSGLHEERGGSDRRDGRLPEGESPSRGPGQPCPVEYKRGKPKENHADEVQLCAQALCLEEMLGVAVPSGAIFYGQTRHRKNVSFSSDLRRETEDAAARLHELLAAGRTPRARREPKCDRCSLLEICMPDALGTSAQRYLLRQIRHATAGGDLEGGGVGTTAGIDDAPITEPSS